MVGSVTCFSIMDICVKWLDYYPIGQVLFLRFFIGFIPIFLIIPKDKLFSFYKTSRPGLHTFRAISGAFAGLAGVGEVSGPIGVIYRDISPNYGFTAIIVCFLGRLHPLGIIFASLVIALTYLGAEDAQLFLQIPAAVGFVFQGLVLFFLLGSDLLVNFKLRLKN